MNVVENMAEIQHTACSEQETLMREMCRRLELADDFIAALEKRIKVAIDCWKQLEGMRGHLEKENDDFPKKVQIENCVGLFGEVKVSKKKTL